MNKWYHLESVFSSNFQEVPLDLWSDKEFVLHACHWNGFNFRFVDNNLKQDSDILI